MTTTPSKRTMLRRLASLCRARADLETEIGDLVGLLRAPDFNNECDATWQEIADAMGRAKSSVIERYGR